MEDNESGNINANKLPPTTSEKIYFTPAKIGLFVGAISFFVVSFFSFGNSLCCGGIFLPICAGLAVGWLTARYTNLGPWDEISKFGEKAGLVAGVFVLLGNIVGGYMSLVMFKTVVNIGPFQANDVAELQPMFSSFIVKGIFYGVIGLIISAIAGSFVASKVYENDQKEQRNK